MPQRILSISGLRGVIGDGLDPGYLVDFSSALGTMFSGGSVVLARDGRATGEMLKHAVISGLLATGCRVLDADITATPTCGVLVQEHKATGGLMITASHNPVEWNGLKPFSSAGSVFDQGLGENLLEILSKKSFRWASWKNLGTCESIADPGAPHLARVLALVDGSAIAAKRFKVVLDCNHGSGSILSPRLLEELGCQVEILGGTADGQFSHPPEPLEHNLTGLAGEVKRRGADVGFAQDPDADRLAIVDNTGRYIGEELTLALCADYVLARNPGPVVVNGSTSRTTADVAAKYGCQFHRSYVGEAHVAAKMRAVGAVIGGEGNGGLIEPRVGYVRDSFAAMAYVLAGLATGTRSLAAWVDSLPQYSIVKDKLDCTRDEVAPACTALQEHFHDAKATAGDGLRLDWSDRWVQLRASNTEPIARVIAEAPDVTSARRLCTEAMEIVAASRLIHPGERRT
ncbi:MAG: phosphoglucosamine mutase [Planctomycetia bacterium]|nr:phosphoglucosamine mutase [Planctomycetia bacterium]